MIRSRSGLFSSLHHHLLTLSLAALTTVSFLGASLSQAAEVEIANISPGLFRGKRPTPAFVEELAKRGFKTIINLEDDRAAVSRESTQAHTLGLRFLSEPMNAGKQPSAASIKRVLDWMSDRSLQPIFLHCLHGQDRTGLAVGIYRVDRERWDVNSAWSEMLKMGFHAKYTALVQAFREWTATRSGPNH